MSIANELITRGWTSRYFEDEKGAVCLGGACHYALGIAPWVMTKKDPRGLALARAAGLEHHYDIQFWNDDPSRTFDEVLRVAKEADELLDGLA